MKVINPETTVILQQIVEPEDVSDGDLERSTVSPLRVALSHSQMITSHCVMMSLDVRL